MKKEIYVLVRGIVRFKNKYLILKKRKSNKTDSEKWECPGGKIENDEDPRDCLLREISEETGLKVRIVKELPALERETETFRRKSYVFVAETFSCQVIISEEHQEFRWVNPENVQNFDLASGASSLLVYFNNPEQYLN